ncbi:hypothetical protein BD770DRAFT_412242 [Pilaira anomala]|nr:hypothetical protein BD770DRAFT_412242 [Pilaira anomala]
MFRIKNICVDDTKKMLVKLPSGAPKGSLRKCVFIQTYDWKQSYMYVQTLSVKYTCIICHNFLIFCNVLVGMKMQSFDIAKSRPIIDVHVNLFFRTDLIHIAILLLESTCGPNAVEFSIVMSVLNSF